VIRDTLRCFEEIVYPKLLARISDEGQGMSGEKEVAKAERGSAGDKDKIENQQPKIKNLKSEIKNLRTISVAFDKVWLADEGDVERYLKAMREALLTEIHKGKKIQI